MAGISLEELEKIVENWDESEDEFEEDENLMCNEDNLNEVIHGVLRNKDDEGLHSEVQASTSSTDDRGNELQQLKEKYKKLLWKSKDFERSAESTAFRGNTSLTPEIVNLKTAYDFFHYFFSDDIVEHIVEESNLYATECDPSHPYVISSTHFQKFLGICCVMSVVCIPDVRRYWNPVVGNKVVIDTMTCNTFEKIRSVLHFNKNSTMLPKEHQDHDRLHKIRPLVDHLVNRYKSIPLEESLSLDEQICATKAKSYLKQYLPAKPHKWGYKLFVLSGVSGLSYNFEIYTGKASKSNMQENEKNLGASANVVTRLTRDVPKNVGHKIYFDNYYTTIPLLVELEKNGIHSVGTIRRNRIPNCKIPTEKEVKNEKRGTSFEYVANSDGVDISALAWKDNKLVTLASTFAGKNPVGSIRRFDKTECQSINIDCPNIVKTYNKHMGGVDLLDSLIGRYRIKMRSKKWYIRIFYHLLDMTVVNSWLLYRRVCTERDETYKSLCEFRIELAESLCKMGHVLSKPGRGRPSSSSVNLQLQQKKRAHSSTHEPAADVRKDDIAHWPVWTPKRLRCKFPNCTGFTYTECEKCKRSLCFNKDRNCFKLFHTS